MHGHFCPPPQLPTHPLRRRLLQLCARARRPEVTAPAGDPGGSGPGPDSSPIPSTCPSLRPGMVARAASLLTLRSFAVLGGAGVDQQDEQAEPGHAPRAHVSSSAPRLRRCGSRSPWRAEAGGGPRCPGGGRGGAPRRGRVGAADAGRGALSGRLAMLPAAPGGRRGEPGAERNEAGAPGAADGGEPAPSPSPGSHPIQLRPEGAAAGARRAGERDLRKGRGNAAQKHALSASLSSSRSRCVSRVPSLFLRLSPPPLLSPPLLAPFRFLPPPPPPPPPPPFSCPFFSSSFKWGLGVAAAPPARPGAAAPSPGCRAAACRNLQSSAGGAGPVSMETASPGAGRSGADRAQSMDQCKPARLQTKQHRARLVLSARRPPGERGSEGARGAGLHAHLCWETKRARGVGEAGAEVDAGALRRVRESARHAGHNHLTLGDRWARLGLSHVLPTLTYPHLTPSSGLNPYQHLSPL